MRDCVVFKHHHQPSSPFPPNNPIPHHPNPNPNPNILDGSHPLVEMRESKKDDDDGQRGMYAKCDMEAGTKVVVARPIVVCWDVEVDEEEEDLEEDYGEDVEGDEDYNGNDDDSEEDDDADVHVGKELSNLEATLENVVGKLDTSERPSVKKASQKAGKSSESDQSDDDEHIHDEDENDSTQEPTGTARNGMLILRCLQNIERSPSIWTNTLSKLYPRTIDDAVSLPPWFCSDPTIGLQIETAFSSLPSKKLFGKNKKKNVTVCEEITARLPYIVRYNVLSMETSSELFVYPDVAKGGMANLAGTGLYGLEVSYLNHSCRPNVSRYCIGDVMFFVTNRAIKAGEELCFSYIEHEVLCENAKKRSMLLDMDFELQDDDDDANGKDDEGPAKKKARVAKKLPSTSKHDKKNNDDSDSDDDDDDADIEENYPMIDAELQREIMAMPPNERMPLLDEFLQQPFDPEKDYQCDKYQLRILKAITLDGLGKFDKALVEWETALEFAIKNYPTVDETIVALMVQAALCAQNCYGNKCSKKAKRHAKKALKMHDTLFGGGTKRFLKRYEKEFACSLRPIPLVTTLKHVRELFGE